MGYVASYLTMRQTHSLMICNFPYYSQLFGEDEDATGELDEAEKQGENGEPSSFRSSHVSVVYASCYRPTF